MNNDNSNSGEEKKYNFWANKYQPDRVGETLKYWVEKTYLKFIYEATDKNPGEVFELIEIGPGKGYFADIAVEAIITYTGIEASKVLADELSKKYEVYNIEFPKSKLPTQKHYDIVYMSHVLEHCDTRKEAVSLISECNSLLNESGYIVINCPNVLSHGLNFWVSDYTHNYVTTPLRVKNLLLDHGFSPVLEKRMVFGVSNYFLRKIIQMIFFIVPDFMFDFMTKKIRGSSGGAVVYGCENFTIIAKKVLPLD